jgi:hypothetical protein
LKIFSIAEDTVNLVSDEYAQDRDELKMTEFAEIFKQLVVIELITSWTPPWAFSKQRGPSAY